MKQETIEEVAERLLRESTAYQTDGYSEYQNGRFNGIIEGIKFQQGRSYSEEEVKFIERLIGFYWVENNSEHPNNLEEWELSKKLIKQFKKK